MDRLIFKLKSFFAVFSNFVFLTLVHTGLSVDLQFQACEPKNCGNGPNISYPFWILDDHPDYCGHPRLRIICRNNDPILQTPNNDYIVKDIFYGNRSFRILNSDAIHNSCPAPLHNFTMPRSPFRFGQNIDQLLFFYNCTSPYQDENFTSLVPCNTNSSLYSFAVLSRRRELDYLTSSLTCKVVVGAPIELDGESISGRNYAMFLKKGFSLRWVANNCVDCHQSGGRCGMLKEKFVCFCPDQSHSKHCSNGFNKKKVLIGVGTGLGGILLTCIVFIVYKRLKRKRSSSSSALISRDLSRDSSLKPDPENGGLFFQTKLFTYKELDEATNHFDSSKELGDGGFGTVYHGKLRDGRVVAVKRLFEHNYKRVEQFMNEIEILSRLRHQNLVSLYGCTSRHSRELLLVYEFVPNGTVADHLHGERVEEGLLTWPIRMSIAIQSADALAYLHASEIIHRDVKSNNILLDNNFHVKVADFGLSRLFPTDVTHVSTAPQGTPGYVDPEYYQCYQLTNKSDVYSFGVVLIELISSKPAVDIGRHRHEINLANMAVNRIHNQALHELVDPSLGYDTDYSVRNMITLVAELAFRCLQQENEMRPCMTEVLEILRGIEKEEYKKRKTDDMDTSAGTRLLKTSEPLSPDTVTGKWPSKNTTPNTSG